MSYCRMGEDSDVYIIYNIQGYYECVACKLGDKTHYTCDIPQDMLDHLLVHNRAGHKVPDRAIDRLVGEFKNEQT